MKTLLRHACSARIAASALRIALVVGSVLNAINQGGAIFDGKDVDWSHLLLNYLVPYCVASYSAAKNEMRESDE
ncbi:MAG: nitrate/nitrite transporter NrtS [Burkholderiales bacterium]|nr:nitrate/nitrite transporter NrtS [Burkholderiales bacterium]